MVKQKPKKYPQERLCVMLETIFEGDECIAAYVSRPGLSHPKISSMGWMLTRLAILFKRKEEIQDEKDGIDKEISVMMWGDKS